MITDIIFIIFVLIAITTFVITSYPDKFLKNYINWYIPETERE